MEDGEGVKERGIIMSVTTGKPTQRGKRLRSQTGKSWRERNREGIRKRSRALYALNRIARRERQARYKRENRVKVRAACRAFGAEYRPRLRRQMIEAYGGKCACCGETESLFLQLDHIHNDGAAERRLERVNSGGIFWARLKKRGWPKGRHQLLCANCNFGKFMNKGVCPHVA